MKQVIQYAKDKNMTISTPNIIFDKFKNIIEVPGKIKIRNDGLINEISNTSKVNIIYDNTKIATDLLTFYKEKSITYTMAFKSTLGNENLPDNGTLETVNIGVLSGTSSVVKDYNFRHQKLYGLNGGIWYRQPSSYNNWAWGDWKVLLATTQAILTETITITTQTIPANSSIRIPFELINKSKINSSSVVVVSPNGGIEDHITYSVDMWGTNGFGIRLYNVSGSSKGTAQRNWTVKIIN